MRSGSFLDIGVKKFETAFSMVLEDQQKFQVLADENLLVVVDSTGFRFLRGGGDRDSSLCLLDVVDIAPFKCRALASQSQYQIF